MGTRQVRPADCGCCGARGSAFAFRIVAAFECVPHADHVHVWPDPNAAIVVPTIHALAYVCPMCGDVARRKWPQCCTIRQAHRCRTVCLRVRAADGRLAYTREVPA